jgi:Uma2 family endonuclease
MVSFAPRIDEGQVMGTITRITFDEFLRLPEGSGEHYELSEGELIMEASPTLRHNRIRDRIARRLHDFVSAHKLGLIISEMDFRLSPNTVRNPDVAYLTTEKLRHIDVDSSPIEGAPVLAVEVISPGNSAADMLQKVHQYLDAGCQTVWVVYPGLALVAIHDSSGSREVKDILEEESLFAGIKFSLLLLDVFDKDLTK